MERGKRCRPVTQVWRVMRARVLRGTSAARRVASALVCLSVAAYAAHGQSPDRLGTITFPTSGNAAAQPAFIRGMLLYYSFEYDRAAAAFRDAQKLDPTFALAYWGEALTYTHQVWNQQDVAAARAALTRLAPTRDARVAKARTPRERQYYELVEVLYGAGDKAQRDTSFNTAAARLERAYPNEDEPRVLHALGLLGLNQGARSIPDYMQAGALAEAVLRRNPDHPGAAHFTIHAFDDPVHAPLGLWAARLYAGIAPGAPHAQHMTSHIFLAVGLWDDLIAANVRAAAGQARSITAAGGTPRKCGHYNEWLEYGYLQAGRFAEAREVLAACAAMPHADGSVDNIEGYAGMRAAQIVDAGPSGAVRPTDAAPRTTTGARVYMAFGDGYAAWLAGGPARVAAVRGAADAASEIAARDSGASADPYVRILITQLRALERSASGDDSAAIALARDAAQVDDSLPVPFGPPLTVKPPHELAGDMLLKAGRAREAQVEYERALRGTPGRSRALFGLARAALAAGDSVAANAAAAQLRLNWHAADSELADLAELNRLFPVTR